MDHVAAAKELIGNFWDRDPMSEDLEVDAQFRIAEILPVIAHALIAIAENGRNA